MVMPERCDIAIVGMGPAGLYMGWRLATADPESMILGRKLKDLKVALFDTQPKERVGGRLCTQPLPGYPFLTELGGMRFRGTQRLVRGLVHALGLWPQVQEFRFDQHFYFLRGRKLLEKSLKSASAVANGYRLKSDETHRLPHELIEAAIRKVLASLEFGPSFIHSREASDWGINHKRLRDKLQTTETLRTLSAREWAIVQRFAEYRREHQLSDVGFWDLLQFHMSSEAWHLAHDGLGYESIMGNWNAAIALPWFLSDFASTEAFTLKNGMSSLPQRMHDVIAAAENFTCTYEWDLADVDMDRRDVSSSRIRLRFTTPTGESVVSARAVVLALPTGALIRMNYGSTLIDKVAAPELLDKRLWFSDQLNAVDGKPLFKLFLGYRRPWWKNKSTPTVTGKVNTDLPLRQVYYYGSDQWNDDRAASLKVSKARDKYSMIMASYSDSHYIEFWSELAKPRDWAYCGLKGGKQALLLDDDRRVLDTYGAPRSMILRAEHQLGLLHGRRVYEAESQPRAEVGLYMEWSRPPYYAGWHSWKVGVDPWDVCRVMLRPFGDANVHICGEAYSDEQGWTEGALKSTERLLTQMYNLPLPSEIFTHGFGNKTDIFREYIGVFD